MTTATIIARTTRQAVARKRRTLGRAQSTPSMRSRVEGAFRTLAHGVEAPAAQGAASSFYRSSGYEWARCLG